jgi:hypothetical protein
MVCVKGCPDGVTAGTGRLITNRCAAFTRTRPGHFDPEYEYSLFSKIYPPGSN